MMLSMVEFSDKFPGPCIKGSKRNFQWYIFYNQKARIKKIMQDDEEIGKVAQATPILICTLT